MGTRQKLRFPGGPSVDSQGVAFLQWWPPSLGAELISWLRGLPICIVVTLVRLLSWKQAQLFSFADASRRSSTSLGFCRHAVSASSSIAISSYYFLLGLWPYHFWHPQSGLLNSCNEQSIAFSSSRDSTDDSG